LLLALGLSALARAADLPTVASTDLCADLILLRVAAPEQIVSVSRAGHDPRLSPLAERARAYPANRGQVEELLRLKPRFALVYAGWNGRRHADLLAARGIETIALPYPHAWHQALDNVQTVATRIGRAAQGAALVASATTRMQALAHAVLPERVLYLRPSGGTAGAGTYVDALLTHLGWRNLAAERGLSGWGGFPLEQLLLTPPERLLLGYFTSDATWTTAAYARHPVFAALRARLPTLVLPGHAWGCGGLDLIDVAEDLVARGVAPGHAERAAPHPD